MQFDVSRRWKRSNRSWLHASTIQWLSDTGEANPPELRDKIQPRLKTSNAAATAPETNEMARATQGKVKHAVKPGFRLTGPASIATIALATRGN